MHIIFQFKLFLGETKFTEIMKVLTFPTFFSSHAHHATPILVNIFLFERIRDKNNIGVQ